MCFVQNLIILIRNWTKRTWDHSLISLVTIWLHIHIYGDTWQVDIYERDMSGFSDCDDRLHIMLSSKIFHKVHIRNNNTGIVTLSFRNSVWKIFMILGWLPGITCICGWYYTCKCNIMLVFGISGHSWSLNWMVCDAKKIINPTNDNLTIKVW